MSHVKTVAFPAAALSTGEMTTRTSKGPVANSVFKIIMEVA